MSRPETRRYISSSSFKMALLFTLLLGLSAAVLGYFSYYFAQGRFIAAAKTQIDTENAYLALADSQGTLSTTLAASARRAGHIYRLSGPDGRYLAGNLVDLPAFISRLVEGTVLFRKDGHTYAAKIMTFHDGRRLLTGIDVTRSAKSYRVMQWLSILSILFMALVVLVSFVISTFVVNRTNRIAETARSIMATGDLSQRIAIDSRWDDLSNMAFVLNALLGRVEFLMHGIRSVSDNIAHDLRTPLTRLLNSLETLRGRLATGADSEALAYCDAMIGETSRLLSTFNALLRISAAEAGSQRRSFTPVDLYAITADVVEFYEPLAEQKDIVLTAGLSPVQPLPGDRDMLFQTIANLLDNALKFTPDGGRIDIRLAMQGERRILTVTDNGPGISPEEREKVFDRFYRAESSRTTEGNGLGLSLVAAVAELHGGEIGLADAGPGLCVTLQF